MPPSFSIPPVAQLRLRTRQRTVLDGRCLRLSCQKWRRLGTATSETTAPRRKRWTRPSAADNVHVDSLEKTVDAHYNANRAALIRRVDSADTYRESAIFRPDIMSPTPPDSLRNAIARMEVKKTSTNHSTSRERKGRHNSVIRGLRKKITGYSRGGDYTGKYFPVYAEWAYPGHECPWTEFLRSTDGDAYQRLDAEILAFQEYFMLNEKDATGFDQVLQRFKQLLYTLYPEISFEVVGSRATGLAVPLSDIDIRVSLSDPDSSITDEELLKTLYTKLQNDMTTAAGFLSLEYVKAQIPIIKCNHVRSNLLIQIQAKDDCVLSKEYVRNYLAEFPTLPSLYWVTRSMLDFRGFIGTIGGGLGSYSLLMMLVASLKLGQASLPSSSGALPSHQLLQFLQLYRSMNFYEQGISVEPARLFDKRTKGNKKSEKQGRNISDPVERGLYIISLIHKEDPWLMCLQDPADAMNDLGRRTYAIKHIQATIDVLHQRLLESMETWDAQGTGASRPPILAPLLAANYSRFKVQRESLGTWGRLQPWRPTTTVKP